MSVNFSVFHDTSYVNKSITSKMIKSNQSLSAQDAWKRPFLVSDNQPVLADRIQAALCKGPFIALAKLGPKYYDGEPKTYTKQIVSHPKVPVLGWKPAQRKQSEGHDLQPIIVCGVLKKENREYVFYHLARGVRQDFRTGQLDHQQIDDKVYVSSTKVFSKYLSEMYPQATPEELEADLFLPFDPSHLRHLGMNFPNHW